MWVDVVAGKEVLAPVVDERKGAEEPKLCIKQVPVAIDGVVGCPVVDVLDLVDVCRVAGLDEAVE
jgi:hypothetical protein